MGRTKKTKQSTSNTNKNKQANKKNKKAERSPTAKNSYQTWQKGQNRLHNVPYIAGLNIYIGALTGTRDPIWYFLSSRCGVPKWTSWFVAT
mmetsp:Transcript_28534/g.46837  ORF Transcript_28534/g.46837 Transcript_28534/m.46837 type:complete len:91 (-) Transcript_28534:919-1191(-)